MKVISPPDNTIMLNFDLNLGVRSQHTLNFDIDQLLPEREANRLFNVHDLTGGNDAPAGGNNEDRSGGVN